MEPFSVRRSRRLMRGQEPPKQRTLHVEPINDTREHIASPTCWCNPSQDPDEPRVYIHHQTN